MTCACGATVDSERAERYTRCIDCARANPERRTYIGIGVHKSIPIILRVEDVQPELVGAGRRRD